VERLPDASALARWLVLAGVFPDGWAGSRATPAQVQSVRDLREAVYRLMRAVMAAAQPVAEDMELINGIARQPDLALMLDWNAGRLSAVVDAASDTYGAVMSTIARDAITLVTGGRVDRLKECAHPSCSLLFFDESQQGRRRWCSMERCGNQAKVSAFRKRDRPA
jgi:predicted RNA-binding Zn ribbon-like protein